MLYHKTMMEHLNNLTEKQADLSMLILESQGIKADFIQAGTNFDILVDDKEINLAIKIIDQFYQENLKEYNENEMDIFSLPLEKNVMIFSVLVLAAIYFGSVYAGNEKKIIMEYGSSAFYILNGEYYRIVTALMLHAGLEHLAGNAAGLLAFGIPVCTIAGSGTGLLLLIISGAAGNLINAYMYRTAHLSIGASTSVMGAAGILVAFQTIKKLKFSGITPRLIIPFGAGAALLGMLSGGKNTDISAHFFGFIAGLISGFIFSFFEKQDYYSGNARQIDNYCLFFALAIIIISWLKLI